MCPIADELSAGAQRAHGLQMAQLRAEGRHWPEVAVEFARWLVQVALKEHPSGCRLVFVGHNIER